MRKGFLFLFFLLTIVFAYGQSPGESFRKQYRQKYLQLLEDFSKSKDELDVKNKHLNSNDTLQLIHDLLVFDIQYIQGNSNLLKEKGKLIKAQEILFNDYHIQSIIGLKYLKSLYLSSQTDDFEQAYQKLNSIAKKNRDYYVLSKLYSLNANYKATINQRDSSIYYTNLALITVRKQTDKLLLIDIVLEQSDLYKKLKNNDLSISKAYLALQLSVQSQYVYGSYRANMILANINTQLENQSEARRNLEQASEAANRMNFTQGIQYAKLLSIQLSSASGQVDWNVLQDIKQKAINNPRLLAFVSIVEAQFFMNQTDFEQAQSRLNSAMVEYEKLGDIDGLQMSYQLVSTNFLKQKKYDKAIQYLQKSYSLLQEGNNQTESVVLLRKIADIYEQKGETMNAFRFLKRYVATKDSLQLSDLQMNLLLQQEQSKADERERLITLQSDSIQEQRKQQDYTTTMLENVQLKNNLKTYIIIGFAGLMLLAGIIIFFKWNQNLIQQRQNEAEMNQTLLRSQMNPHFVFNAMSVIQSYIYENDIDNSSRFLVNFSKLMRLILENSSKEIIPLKIENEILEKYLNVQKLRFEDRFKFRIFTEQNLLDDEVMIPPMITQPFIENAIEHGQLHLKEDGFISVTFKQLDERLIEIQVIDNGIGWKNNTSSQKNGKHKSMAIEITKSRITMLNKKYRTEGFLKYESYDKKTDSGTVVTVAIPFITNNRETV